MLKSTFAAGETIAEARTGLGRWLALVWLMIALHLLPVARSRAQNHADYRYELYKEESGRIQVQSHAVLGEVEAAQWLSLKAQFVYDSISGATPTGAPPLAGQNKVPTVEIDDRRYAGSFEAGMKYRNVTIRPQVAYSEESDYRSFSLALNGSVDLNQKNTTLQLGVAHNFDEVLPTEGTFLYTTEDKDTTDFLVGITQLLGPKMVLTANFTYGMGHGYFTDPYKGVHFDGADFEDSIEGERRPDTRDKEIVYLALTRYFEPVRGSAEVSYRFYHDTFGITANTFGAAWYQKLGEKVVLSPSFRFYQQSEADFYGVTFPGSSGQAGDGAPKYYSSDYRLSELHAFTYGLSLTWRVHEHVSLDVAYKRYEMIGDDGQTSSDAYPSANVISAGFRLWF